MKSKKIKKIYTLDEAENANFGIRLIYLRQKNKMSQSQLALLINTKPSTISQYESNTRKPVSNILLKIARKWIRNTRKNNI